MWREIFIKHTICNWVECLSNMNNRLFAINLYSAFVMTSVINEQLELGMWNAVNHKQTYKFCSKIFFLMVEGYTEQIWLIIRTLTSGNYAQKLTNIFLIILSGVRLSSLDIAVTIGILFQPQMIDDGDCGAICGMKIGRRNQSTRRKPAPVPLRPPQIPHNLVRAGTRAAAVGSRPLTDWAMARPKWTLNYTIMCPV
jgi:hypothetical protein